MRFLVLVLLVGCTGAPPEATEPQPATDADTEVPLDLGLVIAQSPFDAAETTDRIEAQAAEMGLTVYAKVDHAHNAAKRGMAVQPTYLVLLGKPEVGTALMNCSRTVAIDLPQKVLIWEEAGATQVAYNSPAYVSSRHGLEGCGALSMEKATSALNKLVTGALTR